MDALVDGNHRAEEAGDFDAIAERFVDDAEHDVAGSAGDHLRGGEHAVDASIPQGTPVGHLSPIVEPHVFWRQTASVR